MQESTGESEKEPDSKMLSIEIQKSFRKILKCGIYKELRRRSLLSDEQLNSLINEKSRKSNCTSQEILIQYSCLVVCYFHLWR